MRGLITALDGCGGRTADEREAGLTPRFIGLALEHGVPPATVREVSSMLCGLWRAQIAAPRRPVEVRRAVFEAAAATQAFDRGAALARASAALGLTVAEVEHALFADRPGARRVRAPDAAPSPRQAVELYNLRLLQGILLRAEVARVEVREHVRSVVRQAKLLRLICAFELKAASTSIELSGPLSILRHTTKYGRAFASFLPAVISTPGWALEATCAVDGGRRSRFVATSADPIAATHALPRENDSMLERALARDVRRLGTEWALERESAAVPLPDGGIFFPDFSLRRGAERVLVEVVGFYTPEYLERKVRALAAVTQAPIVVAIDESLACGELPLPAGAVLTFRRRIDAARLLQVVEHAARAWRNH